MQRWQLVWEPTPARTTLIARPPAGSAAHFRGRGSARQGGSLASRAWPAPTPPPPLSANSTSHQWSKCHPAPPPLLLHPASQKWRGRILGTFPPRQLPAAAAGSYPEKSSIQCSSIARWDTLTAAGNHHPTGHSRRTRRELPARRRPKAARR